MARSRKFCFTLNNYTEEDVLSLQNLVCEYIVFGREIAPTTGTPHLQGYISFKSAATIEQLHKKDGLARANFRVAKGDANSNKVYCSKEDPDFFEKGIAPKSQKEKGEGEIAAWADALLCVQEGREDEIRADILARNLKTVEYAAIRIASRKRKVEVLEGPLENEWIYGPTGTGKSWAASVENPGHYKKMGRAKWFDDYNYQDVVWIDDVGLDAAKHGDFFKEICDRYPCRIEVKGGSMLARPRKIVITSNYHPTEIWPDPAVHLPMMRKCKLRHLVIPYKESQPPCSSGGREAANAAVAQLAPPMSVVESFHLPPAARPSPARSLPRVNREAAISYEFEWKGN